MAKYKTKLAVLQDVIQLPDALQSLINAGEKDAIIRRLHAFEVPADRIAVRIGDVEGQQTRRVIAAMTAEDIERERTHGYHRTDIRARIEAPRQKLGPRIGWRPPTLKLTSSQAEAILAAPAERGVIKRLAQEYKLAPAYVSEIRKGHTVWSRGNQLGQPTAPA